ISGVSAETQIDAKLSIFGLVLMEKQIRGGLYGSSNPRVDIPKLVDLYKRGELLLDELVTRTYKLEEINQGYKDMEEGNNLRGVVLLSILNPVQVAEDVATLDVVSGGRVTLGLGLGYVDREYAAFGVDRRRRASRFEEAAEVVGKLWSGDEVSHEGEHFSLGG